MNLTAWHPRYLQQDRHRSLLALLLQKDAKGILNYWPFLCRLPPYSGSAMTRQRMEEICWKGKALNPVSQQDSTCCHLQAPRALCVWGVGSKSCDAQRPLTKGHGGFNVFSHIYIYVHQGPRAIQSPCFDMNCLFLCFFMFLIFSPSLCQIFWSIKTYQTGVVPPTVLMTLVDIISLFAAQEGGFTEDLAAALKTSRKGSAQSTQMMPSLSIATWSPCQRSAVPPKDPMVHFVHQFPFWGALLISGQSMTKQHHEPGRSWSILWSGDCW